MDKVQRFWDWFKDNEAKYFFLNQINDDDEKERLLDEFLSHLHIYCDKLFFLLGGLPNGKQDLIITAEGNIDFFDEVEYLVNQAPQLEYWNIIAFIPPMDGGVIEYDDIKLDPQTMYFIPLESKTSRKIGLRIYTDNYNPTSKNSFLNATHLILDNILGEKSSTLDIGHIEMDKLLSIIDKDELIELTKLLRYVQWKKSKLNI